MAEPVPRSSYPLWVKISLFGSSGRGGLIAYTVASLLAAVLSAVYAISHSRYFYFPVLFLVAALLYWSAMRWVDRNGSWKQ
jgi:hypothetical protein